MHANVYLTTVALTVQTTVVAAMYTDITGDISHSAAWTRPISSLLCRTMSSNSQTWNELSSFSLYISPASLLHCQTELHLDCIQQRKTFPNNEHNLHADRT